MKGGSFHRERELLPPEEIGNGSCTCPDCTEGQQVCKHVQYTAPVRNRVRDSYRAVGSRYKTIVEEEMGSPLKQSLFWRLGTTPLPKRWWLVGMAMISFLARTKVLRVGRHLTGSLS
jgi:hypothetical protein